MNFEFSLFNNPVKLDLDLFKTDLDIETPVLDTQTLALAEKEIKLPEFKPEADFFSGRESPETPSLKTEIPASKEKEKEEEDPWLVETSSTKIITEVSTIEVDPDLFKVDENQTSIFETGQIDINDPNLKWEISDIKIVNSPFYELTF